MSMTCAASVLGRACGLALTLGLATGSAQAAVYTGVWDPNFGAPFTNLGWRGSAAFFVPDACEPAGTADIDNLACGGAAVVTDADVELYDVNAAGQATLATLDFNESTLIISTLRYIGGELAQLATTSSNVMVPAADLTAFGVAPAVGFSLDFTLSGPRLGWVLCAEPTECRTGFNDGVNFPPRFSITRVPEPGSLWLGSLAVLAAAAARRANKPRN